eukprot:gene22735-29438_t
MKKATKARTANRMQREESEYVSFPIITLAHLSSDEKQKVMKLAENLIRVGQEYSAALALIEEMKEKHETEVIELKRNISLLNELLSKKTSALSSMEAKEKEFLTLILVYQTKLQNTYEITRLLSQSEEDLMRRLSNSELSITQQRILINNQNDAMDALRRDKDNLESSLKEAKEQSHEKIMALEIALGLSRSATRPVLASTAGSFTPDRSVDESFYRAFYAETPRSSLKEKDAVPLSELSSAIAVRKQGVDVAVQASVQVQVQSQDKQDQLDVEEVALAVAKNADELVRRRQFVVPSTEGRLEVGGLQFGGKKLSSSKSKRMTQSKSKVKPPAKATAPSLLPAGDAMVTGKPRYPQASSLSSPNSAGSSKTAIHKLDSKIAITALESHAQYYDDSLFDLLDELG